MHHYLPKKIPQTKIKFYQLENESLNISDEHLFVAETYIEGKDSTSGTYLEEQPIIKEKFASKKELLEFPIDHLLTIIESKKESEISRKK